MKDSNLKMSFGKMDAMLERKWARSLTQVRTFFTGVEKQFTGGVLND